MSNDSTTAYLLARMRASGTLVIEDADGVDIAALQEACARGGRRLARCPDDVDPEQLVLSWQDGSEPTGGKVLGPNGAVPAPLRVLAVALRACWDDRTIHPYPGRPVRLETIMDTSARLSPAGRMASREGIDRGTKSALRRLTGARFLCVDHETVRLGPTVAAWTESEVEILRSAYDNLPSTPGEDRS